MCQIKETVSEWWVCIPKLVFSTCEDNKIFYGLVLSSSSFSLFPIALKIQEFHRVEEHMKR